LGRVYANGVYSLSVSHNLICFGSRSFFNPCRQLEKSYCFSQYLLTAGSLHPMVRAHTIAQRSEEFRSTAVRGVPAMIKRTVLLVSSAVWLLILVAFLLSSSSSAQKDEKPKVKPGPSPTIYNPYPFGILPPDLDSELMRVEREIQGIEDATLVQARALPPLTFTTNPPIIHGSGYQAVETLGKLFQYDLKMSPFENVACASCHMPYAAFSGPIPSVNLTMIAYPGSFHFRAGKRTAQRYTYSPDFPVLELNAT
jgi:hypothetical protein